MRGMGGWFRKTLVLLVLILGLGIPMGYWLKGKIARAESRKAFAGVSSLEFPPPLAVKPPSLEPLSRPQAKRISPRPTASLVVRLSGKAWRLLPPGSLTLLLQGPDGVSRIQPVEGKPLAWKDLPPGPWALRLVPSPPGKEARSLWKGETRLAPGEKETLEIPPLPLAALQGRVVLQGKGDKKTPPGPAGLQVRLYTSGGVRTTRTDGKGRFSFQGLLPGPALLVLAGGPSSGLGGTCQEILLQEGTASKVTLELRR